MRGPRGGVRGWPGALAGAGAVVAGVLLTLRPFTSLAALAIVVGVALILAGAGEAMAEPGDPDPRPERLAGGALIATGLAALALPGTTVRVLAVVVGVGLVVGGALGIVAGLRRVADERYASIVGGLAGVVVGALALSWPDVTVLVVALLVGPVAIVLGVGRVIRSLRGRGEDGGARAGGTAPRGPLRRGLRVVGATLALIVALGLVTVSRALHDGEPALDDFYDAPAELPAEPGTLIRAEAFDRALPEGAEGWRILYATTGADGDVRVASGLVVAPAQRAGALPVIAWTHGTTGIAPECAPSALPDPFAAGALFALPQVIERGWALVATDYPGLGAGPPHEYLVGRPAARAALDAVRAARRLGEVQLSGTTVAWGHSQGGGAALWVGAEAATYAPDVPLAGIAALAPASDVVSLAAGLPESPSGSIFGSFVVEGYARAYDDVDLDDYVRPTARTSVDGFIGRCFVDPATLLSVAAVLPGESVFARSPDTGALGRRLGENVPDRPTGVPTLIGQGLADTLVLPQVQRAFAARLCAAGQSLDYRSYAGRDHVGVVAADSPLVADLLAWTGLRIAGVGLPGVGCTFARG
jgi:uncharacterized membrane protein HdeD (DUF308 family)